MRIKDEDWQQVINVNLTASFRLSRAVLRGMMSALGADHQHNVDRRGDGQSGLTNYAASKAGIIGMSKSLASEVATGNNCELLAPGFIETAMTESLGADQHAKLMESVPAGRRLRTDTCAAQLLTKPRMSPVKPCVYSGMAMI